MMTKKKRRMIMIGIPVLVVIIIITILVFLYFTTDMFKSNQTLFFKYFGKNYDNINEIVATLKNEEYNRVFQSDKYSETSELKINYTENYGTTSENTNNAINKLKLIINGETDKENGYEYKNIQLLNKEQKDAEIEYMKNNNTYGIKFSDLFNQYISVENNNLKELFKKLGYAEENLDNIPDSIEIKKIQDINFSKEELEELKNKYLNLIKEKISKDSYSKKSKQKITVNDNDISVNAYILTLTKEQLNNIYLDILQSLKEDEIILKKLEQFQKVFTIYISKFNNNDLNLNELYTNGIEEIIEKINRTNIGNEETNITVYETKGITIKTSIQTPDYEMNFEHIMTNEEGFFDFAFKEKENEIQNIKLIKKHNNLELTIKRDIDSNPKKIIIKRNQNINNDKYNKDINIEYHDDNNKIEISYLEKINLINKLENAQNFNENNNIKLNELKDEQIVNLLGAVKEEITKKTDKLTQDIGSEDVIKMLKNIGIINESIKFENEGISEIEKKRFNSNFEILQGENLKNEEILNIINIIKENLIDLHIVSNKELKIEISRNSSDEQLVKTLEEFIQKDKNRNYNVKLEYDNETGLVKYVTLIIEEKKR